MIKKVLGLMITIAMVLSLASGAFAQEEGNYLLQAEKLKVLGVFQGTDNGFELNRQPTRLEGLVMLIRLLGKESAAKALNNDPCVFQDIPSWGKGYANYAYKNGLTKGIGNNLFGTNDKMNALSYTTFMLRALGYDDTKGDFTYNKALDFANEKGLLSIEDLIALSSKTFLRDHIAKISMLTLYTKTKGTEITLLQKLVNEGAISKAQADQLGSVVISEVNTGQVLTPVEIGKLSNAVVYLEVVDSAGEEGSGSGFYVSKEGNIVTNYHVIAGAKTIKVVESNGKEYTGTIRIIGYDVENDIAVLDIDKTVDRYLEIGDSDTVQLGEDIYAIGSPLGLQNTLSSGIVSAIRSDYIQISAPISFGSSGGALLNNQGKVIGITSAINNYGENLGFAIPINLYTKMPKNLNLDLAALLKRNANTAIPTGVTLTQVSEDEITVSWDELSGVDYYKAYISVSNNTEFIPLTEEGWNQWFWDSEYCILIPELEVGETYNIKVTSVKNGLESLPSATQSITIERALTYREYENYLVDTYGTLTSNGYTAKLNKAFIDEDTKGALLIDLYLDPATLPQFLNMSKTANRENIQNVLSDIATEASYYYNKEVYIWILYSDNFSSYPTAYEKNAIYSETIEFDEALNKWTVTYPYIQVFTEIDADDYYYIWAY